MDALQQLLARESCRELVLRAAACADANDAASLAALFTTDAHLQRPDGSLLQGREAIAAAYQRRPADRITRHLVTNTLVELVDGKLARACSSVLLWSGSTQDAIGPQGRPVRGAQVVGSFDDLCALTPEGWRIAQRRASFTLHNGA